MNTKYNSYTSDPNQWLWM